MNILGKMPNSNGKATILAYVAIALAAVSFLTLLFIPFYQGSIGDASGGPPIPTQATLIKVNGLWVLFPLLTPVILTGIVLLSLLKLRHGTAIRNIGIWAPTGILIIFVVVSSFSIGLYYLPAAIALLASAACLALDIQNGHIRSATII